MQPQADIRLDAKTRPGILENSAVNVVGLVLANGMGALAGLITARVLGAAGIGMLAVAFGIAEFARALTNFTGVPAIMEVHRGQDRERVFGTALTLKLVSSLLAVAVLAAAATWLAPIFRVPAWTILFASTVLVAGIWYEIGSTWLEADNRMVRRNVLLAIGPLTMLVLVALLALMGRLSVGTSIAATLVANVAMSGAFLTQRDARFPLRLDGVMARFLVGYGSRIVVTGLLTMGLLWTDTLMVSALLGNAATGIYNVAFQLTFIMVTASTAMAVALAPALAALAGRGESTALGYQRGTLISLSMSLVVLAIYLVAGRFILGIYGPDFVTGYPALLVLTMFGVAAALAVPVQTLLTIHGRATLLMFVSLAQLAVNVPLNYVLITSQGIVGAALATTSVFLAGTVALWIIARRETGALPLSRTVFVEASTFARRLTR